MSPRSLFLLIDIDNTLYNFADTGFHLEMRERIYDFVCEHVGLTREEAVQQSLHYLHSYGLSLYGYVKHHGVDATAFSDAVHRCSYDKLTPHTALAAMLSRLRYDAATAPTRHHLYFCTNANRHHAQRVLRGLGLQSAFTRARLMQQQQQQEGSRDAGSGGDSEGDADDVLWCGFSYEDQWRLTAPDVANKPMRAAYEAVFAAMDADIADDERALSAPTATDAAAASAPAAASPHSPVVAHKRRHLQPCNMVMVDDSLANLLAPLELGWCAVWHAHGTRSDAHASAHDEEQQAQPPSAPLRDERLAKEPFASAYAHGRLQIIDDILDLERAVHALATLPLGQDENKT